MTYLTFLLVFLVPPIALLALAPRPALALADRRRAAASIPLVMLLAFAYTTPWDNYLVYRAVWGYGEARVLGTLWYVPYEEYAFFLLQPVMTGLLLYHALARTRPVEPSMPLHRSILFFYVAITAAGWLLLLSGYERGLYLGLILGWAGPVLAATWWYGGAFFTRLRRPLAATTAAATAYLWVADALAIRWGIWDIANATSFDVDPLGLPVEEAVFFLATNLLVVQGVSLFLYGDRISPPWQAPARTPSGTARTGA